MDSTKVITGKVRFSYLCVHEPRAMSEGDTPKYSVSLIIPKTAEKTIKAIEAAIAAATELGKAKFGGKIPKNLKTPLRDGDEEKEDDPAYAGSYFITASSTKRPGLVDENNDPIEDKDDIYSGCYGKASINFYAFNVDVNKGIACGLNHLKKLADGEPLGASIMSAAEDFGDDLDDDDDIL